MDSEFRQYLTIVFCKGCKFQLIKVMINKDNYVAVCIDHSLKFVCLSFSANFHSTYICCAYSNIREIFVFRKRIYSAESVVGFVGGKLLSMLLLKQK